LTRWPDSSPGSASAALADPWEGLTAKATDLAGPSTRLCQAAAGQGIGADMLGNGIEPSFHTYLSSLGSQTHQAG